MFREYFIRLKTVFGWRFLGFLFCTQFFVKGTLFQVAASVLLPIFKTINVDASHVQLYITMSMAPWALKPLIGVISDVLRIGGYHKRYYLLESIVIGTVAAFSLIFLPHSEQLIILLVLCFFGLHYQISICDLLSEGTYARIMGEHPESGTDVITLVNTFQTAGQLLALAFVGPLSDINLFYPMFIISTILCVTPLLPTLFGWLPEQKVGAECVFLDRDKIHANWQPFLIVALTGLSGPALALITIYVSAWVGIVAALIIICLAIAGSYVAFPRLIGHVAMYQVISQICKPSLGSAMDFFYTADEQCLPGGPAFSFEYYITYAGIVGAIVKLLAALAYQKWLSQWRFRNVLIFTTILMSLGGISDLIIILRLNIKYGIPDKVFYILGEAILENAVGMLAWIPASAIISKVCPPEMEATTFAFLAGISNFGGMVASMMGATIFKAAGIRSTVGQCNFEALWWLVLTFHILVPMAGQIAAAFLIPDKLQDESLLDETTEVDIFVQELYDEFN